MTQLVVADGRNDEIGDARRDVLFAVDDDARDVGERRLRLRCAAAILRAEEIVRADERHRLKKIGERREARIAAALVVEFAAAQEFQLRSVERVAVNLPVVELDRADGLLGREEVPAAVAQAQIAHERLGAAASQPAIVELPIVRPLFDLTRARRVLQRVAEAVGRERIDHRAQGIGLVADRGRSRRERALARRAAPQLHDLQFFLARAAARQDMAAAVRARVGNFR